MRCCEVEALWEEMRAGVDPGREHVLAHLRLCTHCQEMYAEFEGVAYCLSCLPIVEPPISMVPKILEHIRAVNPPKPKPDAVCAVDSPIGKLYVAFRETGITAISLDRGEGEDELLRAMERRLRRRVVRSSDAPEWVSRTVLGWFRTWRPELDKTDISELTTFEQAALRAAAEIPPGETRSYAWVATAIGQPKAARAVGRVMARNPVPFLYPCHRVVDSSGNLHNYGFGLELKARILEMEGYHPRR